MVRFSITTCLISSKSSAPKTEVQYIARSTLSPHASDDICAEAVIIFKRLMVVTSTDPQLSCKIASSFAKVAPNEMIRITKVGGVEVVDRPEIATEKSSPRTVFDSAIGFVVGMLIAAVVIVTRSMSDTTIYLPEDIEKAIGATVLGQIPDISAAGDDTACWNLTEGGTVLYGEKER